MGHMLTIKDLEERPEGAYYVGPLEEAKAFVREDIHTSTTEVSYRNLGKLTYTVYFGEQRDGDPINWNTCNDFGNGATSEDAWRWALGAAFGPANDEFSAFPLTHNKTAAVRALVGHHFPNAVDIFYSVHGPNATVMDEDGHMWQVFPDGTLKVYRG